MFVFGGLSYTANYTLPSVSSHLYSYSVSDGSWREEAVQASNAMLPDGTRVALPEFVCGCSAHYDARGDRLVILFGSAASPASASGAGAAVRSLVQVMSVANGSWALLAPANANAGSALPGLYRHASALAPDAGNIFVWGGFRPTSATSSTSSRLALSSSLYSLSLTNLTWYTVQCTLYLCSLPLVLVSMAPSPSLHFPIAFVPHSPSRVLVFVFVMETI